MPTELGELRCGHITSVYCGMGWRELFLETCPAVVPCATTDGESGSSLKLEPRVTTKTDFLKSFLLNKPLDKISFFL